MINQASRPGLCRVRSVVALVIAILTSVVTVVPVPAARLKRRRGRSITSPPFSPVSWSSASFSLTFNLPLTKVKVRGSADHSSV